MQIQELSKLADLIFLPGTFNQISIYVNRILQYFVAENPELDICVQTVSCRCLTKALVILIN